MAFGAPARHHRLPLHTHLGLSMLLTVPRNMHIALCTSLPLLEMVANLVTAMPKPRVIDGVSDDPTCIIPDESPGSRHWDPDSEDNADSVSSCVAFPAVDGISGTDVTVNGWALIVDRTINGTDP